MQIKKRSQFKTCDVQIIIFLHNLLMHEKFKFNQLSNEFFMILQMRIFRYRHKASFAHFCVDSFVMQIFL